VSSFSVDDLVVGERESITSRFARGLDEIVPSEKESRSDAALSFRGYESFRALEDYIGGSVSEMVVGQGFGATVNLGEVWVLGGIFGEESGDVEFEELLIIHNGYLMVLVKYGFLGLWLYLYFIYSWIRLSKPKKPVSSTNEMFYRLLVSITAMMLMYSLLVSGLLNKSAFSGLLMIIGALLFVCHLKTPPNKKIESF